MGDQVKTTMLASNIHYRADLQIRYMDYGHGKGETRNYDLQGRLLTQDVQDIYRQTYTYDANGNATASAIDYINPAFPDVNLTGGYDALDRLTNETGPTAAAYAYDANGNRLSDGTDSYSYASASNRLTQVDTSAFTYDAAGNLLSDGTRTLTYTPQGQVESVTTAQGTTWYAYNLAGQRTRKTLPGGAIILYHYDEAGHLLAETNETGTPIKSYVWLENMPLAQIDHGTGGDAIYILHTDHLGTPRLVTTLPGGTVWRWEGSAFGDIPPIGSATINLRFPGQYFDAESGLIYNWNRYYDPRTGRYLTSDPIGLRGGQLNTYAYVGNNPLRYIDPRGLQFWRGPWPGGTPGGSVGGQGSAHTFFFGGSVSQTVYGDLKGNKCLVTQVCIRVGPGWFGGAGGAYGFSSGSPPSPTPIFGPPSSIGAGADFGTGGPAGGGSVQFGGDGSFSAGSGWGGAGFGFSAGIDICWTPVVEGDCGCSSK